MLDLLVNFSFKNSVYFLYIRARVNLPGGHFEAYRPVLNGWTHIVLNYIGPNNGDGIKFYNGAEVMSATTRSHNSFPAGDGRVVIGRYFTNQDMEYSSVQIDELIYFNNSLTNGEIEFLGRTV